MFNKALLMVHLKKDLPKKTNGLEFVASSNKTNVDLFEDNYSSSWYLPTDYTVYLNDEETDMAFNSLTFVSGDVIRIEPNEEGICLPAVGYNGIPCSSVGELPIFTDRNRKNIVVQFSYLLYASSVASLPKNFLGKNRETVEGLYCSFWGCSALTNIPDDLLKGCVKLSNVEGAFINSGLETIREDMLEGCVSLNNMKQMFTGCKGLSGRLRIESTGVTSATGFCTNCGAITVVVPAGSTTETTFRSYAATVTNLTVETY